MLINEVSKKTGLTKKAIEYYSIHNLIQPQILPNGYRFYNEDDIEKLEKISILRKLDISIKDIKKILQDNSLEHFKNIAIKKELNLKREKAKKELIENLSIYNDFSKIKPYIQSIEKNKKITDKILDAFPGYYGRFICLHFSYFLNEPITNDKQQKAYDTIIDFLDNVKDINLPQDLQDYINQNQEFFSIEKIENHLENLRTSIENPDDFLSNNKDSINEYLKYKESEEYKNSPAYKIMNYMQDFFKSNNYYEVFIPALRELSPAYDRYYKQSEVASKKLISQFMK